MSTAVAVCCTWRALPLLLAVVACVIFALLAFFFAKENGRSLLPSFGGGSPASPGRQ